MESRNIKILAIDDNQDNLTSLKALIKDAFPQAVTLTALNGIKGFELAAAEDPDVILLDIVMPDMDGYEVCKKLKADKKLSDIPVIFVTALKGDKEGRIRALQAGAEAFLAKPVDESELTALIRAMVKIKTANDLKISEKEQLSALVAEQTREMRETQTATLNLLEEISRENEARKKSEMALRESEEKYRTIFENVQDVFYQTDFNGIVLEISPSIKHFSEFNREEIIGFPVYNLYSNPDDREVLLKAIKVTGELRDYELTLKTKTGDVKYVSINARLASDSDGKPNHIDGAIRDITERKKAEKTLYNSEMRLRSILDATPFPIALVDLQDDTIMYWSQSAFKLFGHTAPTAIEWYQLAYPDPDYQRKVIERWKAALEKTKSGTQTVNAGEYRVTCHNGSVRICELYATFLADNLIVTFNDITDRKLSEGKLLESKQIIEEIINNIPARVFWKDRNLVYKGCNTAFALDAGYSAPEDIIGKDDFQMGWYAQAEEYRSDDRQVINSGCPKLNFEEQQTTPDGKTITLLTNKVPLQNPNGEITGVVGTYLDITERKLIEETLNIAKEKAEQSDRLKSAFLANMSHEIRTPMNGILGFAQLLKEPDLTGEDQQNYIRIIEKSGARMLRIIHDIVDISKIESGQMEISISESNINEQIEYIYDFFKPEIEKKGLQLVYKTTLPPKESIVKTDHEKIYAILTNLVKNAIKCTNDGSIEFGYEKKGKYLEFYVKDTGIGIPEHQEEIIFERFRQGDDLTKKFTEGTGLGLSISKAYVEMLGGKIWVESEFGRGSTFYFTIPYTDEMETKPAIKDSTEQIQADHKVKNLKVLIAEDDEASASFLSTALTTYCREILIAETGVEAVGACRDNPDLDLVLMDIRMPEMGGYEATRQIRQFNKDVIIIAQTAYGLAGDREKALKAGCTDYISKPIDINLLKALIRKYFK